jgi:hypothetical protein
MKQLFETIGAGDGEGNTSSTRLLVLGWGACYIASKFVNAYITKQPIAWGNDDLAMAGTLGGILCGKTVAEKSTKPFEPPKL